MPSSVEVRLPVPARYTEATFGSFEASTPALRQALAAAQQVASGESRSLVLIGPPGVGKSHLAAAIAIAVSLPLIEADRAQHQEYETALRAWHSDPARIWNDKPRNGYRFHALPRWVNVPSMVVDLKAEMHLPPDDQEATDAARRLRSESELVVLDDLGRERISEWTGELIYTIVNDRYEQRLPTVATSNLSIPELVEAGYWPAVSRLAEDGAIVEVQAPDHRLKR